MLTLRRKRAKSRTPEARGLVFEDFAGSDEQLQVEIEQLLAANRANRSFANERRLLRLRHVAGLRTLETPNADPQHPEPDLERLPEADGLPEFTPAQLTPALMRAAILRDGCALVRGLIDREEALRFGEQIDGAFNERSRRENRQPIEGEPYYDVLATHPRYDESLEHVRPWVKHGGGLLAADSSILSYKMLELFRTAGVPELVEGYLGERPLITVHKTTLRKAEPQVGGGWHQDGAFMGDVRSINLWLSLSRCGDESPGLDVVPRRLNELVRTGSDETFLEYQVSQRVAEDAAGEKQIIRPIFEPGDALFFDELFLHKTGSDPSMPHPRYAIENWFFGGSAFPAEYAPIAV